MKLVGKEAKWTVFGGKKQQLLWDVLKPVKQLAEFECLKKTLIKMALCW